MDSPSSVSAVAHLPQMLSCFPRVDILGALAVLLDKEVVIRVLVLVVVHV